MPHTTLREQQALGGRLTSTCVLKVHPRHGMSSALRSVTYREYPIRILDSAERVTRRKKIKFLKVQWSHHSEKEATWEREDRLHAKYPSFLPQTSESWDEILLSGGELSKPSSRYVLGPELPCIHDQKKIKFKLKMGEAEALIEFNSNG